MAKNLDFEIKVFGQNQGKRTISRFLARPDEEASGCGSKIINQTLPKRLCKTKIFHSLPTQVWSISVSIMDIPQGLLDGY